MRASGFGGTPEPGACKALGWGLMCLLLARSTAALSLWVLATRTAAA